MDEYGTFLGSGDVTAVFEEQAKVMHFSPGEVIQSPTVNARAVFLIMRGTVRLFRQDAGGRRLVLATLGQGATFGESAMIGQAEPDTWVEAADDCAVWMLDAEIAMEFARSSSDLTRMLLQNVGRRLHTTERRLEEMAYSSVPERLASVLLDLADEEGQDLKGFSQAELAEMAGTYRETVTQTLNEFKGKGWVDLGRRRVEVRDLDALRELAGRW
jgi:CRP-like cAMP-binding protein